MTFQFSLVSWSVLNRNIVVEHQNECSWTPHYQSTNYSKCTTTSVQCPPNLIAKKGCSKRIFNINCNLGFKTPWTDISSKENIKNETNVWLSVLNAKKKKKNSELENTGSTSLLLTYLNNFIIVKDCSKYLLTTDNAFSYCWTKDDLPKASNQICSISLVSSFLWYHHCS